MEEIAEEQEGERQLKRVNKQDKTEGTATRSGCAPNKHTGSDELRETEMVLLVLLGHVC